jgi:hypothetical protein
MMERRYAFCEALHDAEGTWPRSMEIVKKECDILIADS